MRFLWRIQQSRARIAAATSAALIALLAAGIGFAPAASASTTGAPSIIHAARTVKPAETPAGKVGPFYAGPYNTVQQCAANLDAIRQNPRFAGGGCYQATDSNGNVVYLLIYYLQSNVCGGVSVAPPGIIAARLAEPASC